MVPMEPTPAPLNELDDFFGVSIDYLLYRTDCACLRKARYKKQSTANSNRCKQRNCH